jgi:hypothetical protein
LGKVLPESKAASSHREEEGEEVAVEATKTALVLAPGETGSASLLLKSGKPTLVRLAILSLLGCDSKKIWPQIEERLYDEHVAIRKLICAYAIKKFPVRRLERLLDKYLAKDVYY